MKSDMHFISIVSKTIWFITLLDQLEYVSYSMLEVPERNEKVLSRGFKISTLWASGWFNNYINTQNV